MYSIGEIISTYRKKKGLLQQDLADELAKEGITISYKAISNWERNLAEPSVTIFYKVCRILGIPSVPLSSVPTQDLHFLRISRFYDYSQKMSLICPISVLE